ncbi:MAG: RNA ligase family protein [Lachnospiraceae bacterium]|nr:RNA ligase family protein [Lachnospiraceae bacterium]
MELIKYPRTPHLSGSRLQPGDEDLSQIPFSDIQGKYLVVEEKCDGANTAVSFDQNGELLLQSRGHYLTGGYRERHYNLLKQWANVHREAFYRVLGSRYVMYGEWMYAKHSVYYDALPHYFLEFDILDRETGKFLDTPSRKALTLRMPVVSVPVLKTGTFSDQKELLGLIGPSLYIRPGHMERLRAYCEKEGLDGERQCRETEGSGLMEGLYIKVEEGGCVTERLKYVRASFMQCILASESHWIDRPIVPNRLAGSVEELFLPEVRT